MGVARILSRSARRAAAAPYQAPVGAFVPSYWLGRQNNCPACTRSNWWIGRNSAECGFCGATLPFAGTAAPELRAA